MGPFAGIAFRLDVEMAVQNEGAASASKPTVLPVMYQPTREEAKRIEARFQCRLKSSDRAERYLATIDDAMKVRADQKKKRMS